ncbi:MAG: lipoate--protein ligase family protein [Candidatus Bipolaricaulota bacterium]|nr:lipoate--protein ligase family protein [Candidatus Bipolaricaulota bacterium]
MRLFVDLTPRNAAFGLAVDEALLESARRGGEGAVRLWVSRRAVIVGRSQAVASECDLEAVRRLGIPVVRRISGGGAVIHYPGNLNVSVTLADGRRLGCAERAFVWFGASIAAGLRKLCVDIDERERMLVVADRKISGAAQARRGDALLVHGTVLVWPDAINMGSILMALRPGYAPLGTRSRPSATATLSDALGRPVSLFEAADAVLRGLADEFAQPWDEGLMEPAEEALADELETTRYRSREWNESR